MLKSLRVTVLVATLACSVFGGDIPNNVVPTPPPPPPTNDEAKNTADQLLTDESIENTVAEVMLNLLKNVLSSF